MALTRLGEGPFNLIEIMEPDYAGFGGWDLPEPSTVKGVTPKNVWDRCACCGARISWRVLVEAPAQGRTYLLGVTCAQNAEAGLDTRQIATMRARAVKRERDRKLDDEGFVAWAMAQPHPKGWRDKTLLDDIRYAVMRKAPRMGALRKAWRTYQEGAVADTTIEMAKTDAESRERLERWLAENGAYAANQPHPYANSMYAKRTNRMRSAKRKATVRAEVDALTLADYVQWVLDNRSDADSYSRALNTATEKQRAAAKIKAEATAKAALDEVQDRWRDRLDAVRIGMQGPIWFSVFEREYQTGNEVTMEALWSSEIFAPAREKGRDENDR